MLAIIPARGGSKGLPKKNIRPLYNKPLIGWTISSTNESKYIDKTIVSTDCEEIALIASELNCHVPFMRPDKLSSDSAKAIDVIAHSLNYFHEYDIFIYLQPTSPLRTYKDIDTSILQMVEKKLNSAVSICKTSENPFHTFFKKNGNILPLAEEFLVKNRQELPITYRLNGAIYASYRDIVISKSMITDFEERMKWIF